MIISILSGKGGTGKTTVAVNLALLLEKGQLLDCDVEEPNDHIFIKPDVKAKLPVFIKQPKIDVTKCNLCKKCSEVCMYNAIATVKREVLVYPELCHSCGACSYICPQNAITEVDREIGFLKVGKRGSLEFIQGILNIGEVLSTSIIKEVKKHINTDKITIIDCPPGTSCPVVESVKKSDYSILVTEASPFGLNDMILAIGVLKKLSIPFGIVVNRSDLGDDSVENYCKKENIEILMRIPFSKKIASSYSEGKFIFESLPEYKAKFKALLDQCCKKILPLEKEKN